MNRGSMDNQWVSGTPRSAELGSVGGGYYGFA